MSIHTIGDSHSGNGWTGIIQNHLGPVLCYSFGKEKLNRCDIRKFNIKDGGNVYLFFTTDKSCNKIVIITSKL